MFSYIHQVSFHKKHKLTFLITWRCFWTAWKFLLFWVFQSVLVAWLVLVGRGIKNHKLIVMSTWSWSAVKLVRALFAGFGWLTSCSVRRAPSTVIPLPEFKKHTTHVDNSNESTSPCNYRFLATLGLVWNCIHLLHCQTF